MRPAQYAATHRPATVSAMPRPSVSSVYDQAPVEYSAPTRAAKHTIVMGMARRDGRDGRSRRRRPGRPTITSGGQSFRQRQPNPAMATSSSPITIHAGRHVPVASDATTSSGPRLVPMP